MPTVSIKLPNEIKKFEVNGDKSLFDELQEQDFELPHGCLSGVCSACKIYVLEGSEQLTTPDPIEANTLDALKDLVDEYPLRLGCRAKLIGSQALIEIY